MIWPEDFINKIICGDSLSVMKEMPDESIDMAITSPPYWGLRDYEFEQIFGGDSDCEHDFGIIHRRAGDKSGPHGPGSILGPTKHAQHEIRMGEPTKTCSKCQAWKGQLGLEPTPEMYIEHLTEIFNEAKRVLKKEGTLWLNIGDTYASTKCGNAGEPGGIGSSVSTTRIQRMDTSKCGLPQKCLCMIPERLTWSLIQNGWILRNKIIWNKPNAMPSSVIDRFSNRWEYVFMFSRSQKYYFDLDAVREAYTEPMNRWGGDNLVAKGESTWDKGTGQKTYRDRNMRPNPDGKNPGDIIKAGAETRTMGAIIGSGGGVKIPGGKGWTGHPKGGGAACQKDPRWCPPEGKNPGDFFEINTQPFPEAHFAVFPEKLCEKPIKAGCPEEVCKKCGKARERIVEVDVGEPQGGKVDEKRLRGGVLKSGGKATTSRPMTAIYKQALSTTRKTIGWTSCSCNAEFEGGIVLDPFAGAGTALYVAKEMKRQYIGIDIKQEYCDMCEKRLAQGVL